MASGIYPEKLFEENDLQISGQILWKEIKESEINEPGIYVVSIPDPKKFPLINDDIIKEWTDNDPNLIKINGTEYKDKEELVKMIHKRMNEFWLANETIVYIGQTTKQTIKKRLIDFKKHRIGKKSPHRGGQWLKTFDNLDNLVISWYAKKSPTSPKDIETKLLESFVKKIWDFKQRENKLLIKSDCYPFANLTGPYGFKQHGINHKIKRG